MDVVKLGKKGQVSLPAAVLRKLGLEGRATLLVEAAEDGSVILRPAGVYPIELYTEARVREFERENRVAPALEARAERLIRGKRRKRR
jgi:AbrB family looped-hinge helix DNA binding protein